MITVYDKLKTFSESIIKDMEVASKQKLEQAAKENNIAHTRERQRLIEEVGAIIDSAERRAEAERKQIISKANIEMEHALLIKRNEIYKIMKQDIKDMAYVFTNYTDYAAFLERVVDLGVSRLNENELKVLLKPNDIEKYGKVISDHVMSLKPGNIKVDIDKANEDIIGGCIVENKSHTRRVDCTLTAMISERMDIIGKVLQENL